MTNKNDYPALNGQTVTQGHTNICKENGHATHTINGEPQPTCPRCGGSRFHRVNQPVAKKATPEGTQMLHLIDDNVNVCIDCYMDHHEGRPMQDSSAVTWTDNTNSNDEENSGITDFSSTRCGCCGTTLAGARYRMAVWEA